jgi:uncharacterized protein involved in exopolysaccharide biosynthesis
MEERKRKSQGAGSAQQWTRAYEDEISLIDLWLVLSRHRLLVLGVAGVITALVAVYAFVRSPKYSYTTTIEIGTHVENKHTVPIESPDSVLAKITDSYLPDALHAYYKSHPGDDYLYKFKTNVPKGSSLVVLKSKVAQSRGKTVVALENSVVSALKKDHEQITGVIRSGLTLQEQQARHRLEQLQDEEKVLRADLGRLKTNAALLRTQIKETKALLASAQRNQEQAVRRPGNEARAMTMLMIDNQIQQDRNRLASQQEQLDIKLAARRDSLNSQLAGNARSQLSQQQVLKNIQLRIQDLRETRAVVPPVRSIRPVSLKTIPLILLGVIAGLILGVFGAFARDFLARARAAIVQSEESGSAGRVQRRAA